MSTESPLVSYIHGCAAGALKVGDCGPVWQLAVILTLLAAAIAVLVVLRLMAARPFRKERP